MKIKGLKLAKKAFAVRPRRYSIKWLLPNFLTICALSPPGALLSYYPSPLNSPQPKKVRVFEFRRMKKHVWEASWIRKQRSLSCPEKNVNPSSWLRFLPPNAGQANTRPFDQ